jgi:hypothetical protein
MSAWRRVVIIDMYFLTVAWSISKQEPRSFDHHLMLSVNYVPSMTFLGEHDTWSNEDSIVILRFKSTLKLFPR